MFKKSWFNALCASGYIALLVLVMASIEQSTKHSRNEYFLPVIFISMFTLSAAVMGGLFLLQPVLMYLDGKKKQAVRMFFQTVLYFAGVTGILLVGLLSGVIPGK